MKQILIFLLFIGLGISNQTYAEVNPKEKMDELAEIITANYNPASDEDIIEMILQLPFEYRQYVAPALHESEYISQKVRTHPDIIIWRGKKPTRIAPQLQEWAKEHLDYLPANFYPALMPEMWPNPNLEAQPKSQQQNVAQLMNAKTVQFKKDPNSVLNKLDGPRIKITGGSLSEADIKRLPATFKALNDFYENQPEKLYFRSLLFSSGDPDLPMSMRLAFPFHSLMARLSKMGFGEQVNQLLQEQGWKDSMDFANRTDRLLKAYRANSVDPLKAIELYKIRGKYKPDSTEQSDRSLWMYASLYESSPEDIAFAAPYLKWLRALFKRRDLVVAGTLVYVD